MGERQLIGTVGQIRAALDAFDDDAMLVAQVIATNGDVGNMELTVGEAIGCKPPLSMAVVSLRHPQLASLGFDEK